MRRTVWAMVVGLLALPASAHAFCGFYVASGDTELFNEATMVVLLRHGTTTVLSMQNDYHGPPEDFALVVPVPVVLDEDHVKTLSSEIFDRVDHLAAPRLVEYWEQDPCMEEGTIGLGNLGTIGGSGSGYGRGAGGLGGEMVTVEAEFAVGEYDIVILSARESGALETWLRDNDYRIPDGAGEVLRPYVEEDMKFFVARVDPERVTFAEGRAVLSPLRVHYESEAFSLPVRLGLLSSRGTQDLIVHVLAEDQRYEVANYENVTIPTNLDVQDAVRERFGEFYAALFDATVERNPGAVVTEYAWGATSCDPCPGPTLTAQDIASLGADVTHPGAQVRSARFAQVPRIRTGAANVTGSLSPEIIRRVIRRHINEVRFCYEQQLNTTPNIEGRVIVRFTIDAEGAVTEASIQSTTLGNQPTEDCIAQAVPRWTFPAPEGGGVVRVDYPFVLSSEGSAGGFGRGYGGGMFGAGPFNGFVLTRLHYRYGQDDLGEDLVFRAAEPIVGGREIWNAQREIEQGARPAGAGSSTFQGRYVIRHAWEGAIECEEPRRGIWGDPWEGEEDPGPAAARDLARVTRGRLALGSALASPLPSLGVDELGEPLEPGAAGEPGEGGEDDEQGEGADEDEEATEPATDVAPGGCGCRASGSRAAPLFLLAPFALLAIRRHARTR